MKPFTTILSLFFVFSPLFSQTFQRLNAPVKVDGQTLLSPWVGGVNAPQWSKADLNGDGKMDLYAFERDGFVHIPYLNVGEMGEGRYEFAPQLAPNFPNTWNFVLLRDFNGDGVMDFFGHAQDVGIPGIKVYRGFLENGQLKFKLFEFNHWVFDVVTVPLGTGGFANLNISRVDYPAVDDIDGDGDLDILGLDTDSGRDINYYRNHAIEQGFSKDTLIFSRVDDCWGKIYLPDLTTQFLLSGSADTCALPFVGKDMYEKDGLHGASTLCTFDEDNDGDKELLYGDLNFPQIIKGVNGGTNSAAWINSQDTTFPSYDAPVNLPYFPNSFYLDFDNDGLQDLLFNPNEFNLSSDVEIWFYKNVTSNEFPQFSFSKKDALVEDMIDIGKGANPAFFDYNADGLMDFVIGNFERTTSTNTIQNEVEASLYLYKNIGNETEPSFELVDRDWLGLKQFSNTGTPNDVGQFAPAFGDLDQDGDEDLLVGESNGYMFFIENTAGPDNPAAWAPVIPEWKDIRIGNFPTPFIYDLNKDGLVDIIAGEQGGNINFLPNTGTVGIPDFHNNPNEFPNNRFLGKISTQVPGVGSGFSAPVILDFQDTIYLMSGSVSGYLELYQVDTLKLEFGDSFNLINKKFGGLYTGTHSRVTFFDINDDDILEALVGNHRGGVSLFGSPFKIDGTVATNENVQHLGFKIFPNPASKQIYFEFGDDSFGITNYRIINALGQVARQGILQVDQKSMDVASLPNGIYFMQLKRGNRAGVQKVVVQN